jgi:MoaA/NifB/PqqE/SkfB family radical SAM enzyme
MTLMRTLSLGKRGFRNYIRKRPFSVSFEVTYACNARCKHCHLGGPVEEERASPERLGQLYNEIQSVVAIVSGGEPLLRNDLEDIIRAIHRANHPPYIVITTNASLLKQTRYQRLREAGADQFSISLDYPDERHDEFRRIPGLFQKIRDFICELDSGANKAITLSCVVQKDNFRELLKIAKLAADWNVRVNFTTYTWLRTQNKDYLLTKKDLPEFKDMVNQLLELKKRNRNFYPSPYVFRRMIRYFENGFLPDCRAGQRFFIVNPNGAVSPCGLIMKYYKDIAQMRGDFVPANTCGDCNTSIRAECEKPIRFLVWDNLRKA